MKRSNKSEEEIRYSGDTKLAVRVSVITIIVNVALSILKLIAGIVANSGAMLSDAVHTLSDVISTFVVLYGVNVAGKKSDEEHQYGHERMECVAAVLLALLLFATGIGIGLDGIKKIVAGSQEDLNVPGAMALIAAIVSIGVKEWMYWYTRGTAKKIGSGAMLADAWHHRSDALSSVGAFVGILGAKLGFPVLDPVASVVICFFIVKVALDIFKDAINRMVDKSCDETTKERMKQIIHKQKGVMEVDLIRTRLFGSKIYVDIEIGADGELNLNEAHEIAERVHNAIESEFKEVKHCMVHVNPKITKRD